MKRLLPIAAAALLVIVVAVGWTAAEPGGKTEAGVREQRHAELHARCTEARLRLAETRLEKAENLNDGRPGQVTGMDVRWFKARVAQLREQVAATRDKPHGYGFEAQRAAARSVVRLAEEDLAAARATNARRPGAVGPLDIRILEQRHEIARLRAARPGSRRWCRSHRRPVPPSRRRLRTSR